MTKDDLRRVVAESVGIDPALITDDASYIENLGLDSLEIVRLINAIEEEFGIDIDETYADSFRTFGTSYEYIRVLIERLNGG